MKNNMLVHYQTFYMLILCTECNAQQFIQMMKDCEVLF